MSATVRKTLHYMASNSRLQCSEYCSHTMSLRTAEGFAFDMQLRRHRYVLDTIFLLLGNSFYSLLATVQRKAFWKLKRPQKKKVKAFHISFSWRAQYKMLYSAMDKMKYSSYLVMIIFLLKFNPQFLYTNYLTVLPFTPQLGIWKHSLHSHQFWQHELKIREAYQERQWFSGNLWLLH